jgi:hypothetical protein
LTCNINANYALNAFRENVPFRCRVKIIQIDV